eukprot:870138-Alexandrium_andersonii.AAC.1
MMKHEVEPADFLSVFMQRDASERIYALPPKELRCEGWMWQLRAAKNGMRTGSKDISDFLAA